jgi:hypothetical protein
MLVKIQERDNWVLFDGVEQLRYSKRTYAVTTLLDLQRIIKEAYDLVHPYALQVIPQTNWSKVVQDKPLKVCLACFNTGPEQVVVIAFSSIMYVCNNKGGTVEKVQPYTGV